MAMAAHYSELWWYPNAAGTPAANQRAIVFGPGDVNTVATIYADAGLTTPLANPTVTDGSGVLQFYVPDDSGTYWIFVGPQGTGDSQEWAAGATGDAVLSVNGIGPDGSGNVELDATDVGAQPIGTINAMGDLYVGTGNDATTRLPIGTPGEVLTVVAGTASWEPPAGGGAVDSVNGQTGVVILDAIDVGADPAGSAAAAQANAIAASQSLSTIDAAGDLYLGTGNNTTTRLPLGTAGEVLTVAGGTASWEPPASAPVISVNGETGAVVLDSVDVGAQPIATINAAGDLYVGTGDNATTRLPIGSPGEVLTVVGGTASWEPSPADAVTSVNGQTGVVVLDAGDVGADPAGSAAAAAAASQALATIDAAGDLYIGTGDNATTRLPIGSPGEVLTVVGGTASWEPAPADAVTSVNAQTGVVVLDAGDVGADPAGAAAAAQAAAEAASQPLATITQKGGLYVGTGAAATIELPPGADGEVLSANSSEPSGLEWVVPSAQAYGLAIKPRAGLYAQVGAVGVVRSSKAVTLNAMYLRPFVLTDDDTLTAIAWENTNSTATALARLGIYASDAALEPDARIVDFGTFTSDTTGLRAVTGLSQALSKDTLYWMAIVFQTAAPNVRHDAGYTPWVSSTAFPTGAGAGWNSAYVETGVSGALPANTGTIVATDSPALGAAF